MSTPASPVAASSSSETSDQPTNWADLELRLQEAYPAASPKLIATTLDACRQELGGMEDTGRLIRCVCERLTA